MGKSNSTAGKGYTPQEIIAQLKHCNQPALCVEGADDMKVYRELAKINRARLFVCQGKPALLKVYDSKVAIIRSNPHAKIIFLADMDLWLFAGIPNEYNEIIVTSGYSIENDLYAGANDIEYFISDQKTKFDEYIKLLCKWFASKVHQWIANRDLECKLELHVNQIVNEHNGQFDLCCSIDNDNQAEAIFAQIYSNYHLQLRGKQLFDAFLKFVKRAEPEMAFNKRTLFTMCCKDIPTNPYLQKIIKQIQVRLEEYEKR